MFLPITITTLKFGNAFNQSIGYDNLKSYLPKGIKILVFGDDFNQRIGQFPNMREKPKTISDEYYLSKQYVISSFLPINLQKLVLGCNFNKRLYWNTSNYEAVSLLPDSIKELELFYYKLNGDDETLVSAGKSILLPKSLTHLTIKYNKNEQLEPILEQIQKLKQELIIKN